MDGVESREFVLRVERASWTVERERERAVKGEQRVRYATDVQAKEKK